MKNSFKMAKKANRLAKAYQVRSIQEAMATSLALDVLDSVGPLIVPKGIFDQMNTKELEENECAVAEIYRYNRDLNQGVSHWVLIKKRDD